MCIAMSGEWREAGEHNGEERAESQTRFYVGAEVSKI